MESRAGIESEHVRFEKSVMMALQSKFAASVLSRGNAAMQSGYSSQSTAWIFDPSASGALRHRSTLCQYLAQSPARQDLFGVCKNQDQSDSVNRSE